MIPWGTPHTAPIADPLHVIAVVFNPMRFRSRYHLFAQFAAHMASFPRVVLHTVECAFGDRPFEVTRADEPRHLQVRTSHELWLKERLINLGIRRLPPDWRYVAWVDADLTFANPHWADEAIHQLQHYDVVQLFSHATDLGPRGETLQTFAGFLHGYAEGIDPGPVGRDGFINKLHPGYAWAARRSAIDALGGLLDQSILGNADTLMAHALIGRLDAVMIDDFAPGFRAVIGRWAERATALRRNVGYVPGSIAHGWHGAKANRRYYSRREVLVKYQYDPATDLREDWQGVYQLTDRSIGLRDAIRAYFRARDEDGTHQPPNGGPLPTGMPGSTFTARALEASKPHPSHPLPRPSHPYGHDPDHDGDRDRRRGKDRD